MFLNKALCDIVELHDNEHHGTFSETLPKGREETLWVCHYATSCLISRDTVAYIFAEMAQSGKLIVFLKICSLNVFYLSRKKITFCTK